MILKLNSKAATGVVLWKKMSRKLLESLFNKVAGLQDCSKTCLFHAPWRFYFSLGKKLKKFHQLSINNVLLKNVKCKVMFTEAYLEPSWTSMMGLFAKVVCSR